MSNKEGVVEKQDEPDEKDSSRKYSSGPIIGGGTETPGGAKEPG